MTRIGWVRITVDQMQAWAKVVCAPARYQQVIENGETKLAEFRFRTQDTDGGFWFKRI